MQTATQPELPVFAPLFAVKSSDTNIAFLVSFLRGRDWITAAAILRDWIAQGSTGLTTGDYHRRWIRGLADKSGGRVAGGQRGYKLVTECTQEEYQHWRNWMNSQANEMKRRVIEADKVFFSRAHVAPDHGILEPAHIEGDYAI